MNTALIGLDYIVDIMHPDGRIARCAEQAALRGVVARFNRALAVAEQRGWLRIAVRVGFEPGYPDLPEHSPIFAAAQALGALDLCGRGCAFHPDLKRDAVQMEVLKPRISAFYATRLEDVLRARRIERLVLAGVSTTWAVQAAARDAHDRDYQVLVLEEACAAASDEEHRRSIEVLGGIARIVTLDQLAAL
ncbi:TPA: isochorismatase family cysteine hydrolase [Pseudomonas aeruginosa]